VAVAVRAPCRTAVVAGFVAGAVEGVVVFVVVVASSLEAEPFAFGVRTNATF
jgi:hypothetical protein